MLGQGNLTKCLYRYEQRCIQREKSWLTSGILWLYILKYHPDHILHSVRVGTIKLSQLMHHNCRYCGIILKFHGFTYTNEFCEAENHETWSVDASGWGKARNRSLLSFWNSIAIHTQNVSKFGHQWGVECVSQTESRSRASFWNCNW